MTFLVIRHGESEADLLHVHEGRADFPLTARGHAQAEAMAAYAAARWRVGRIYASPLKRAAQTARHLAERTELDVIPDPDLMEFNNGLLAGLPFDAARQKYPPVDDLPVDQAVYGMESKAEYRRRAEAALDRIVKETGSDETVAVVSHGGLINQLWHAFLRLPIQSGCWLATGDTGIHVWRIDENDNRHILRANLTDHADGI